MICIDASKINDWESFHSVFAHTFGFPSFYGRNMNAWIDCMSYLDDPESGMTTVHVKEGETLTVLIENADSFKVCCPEQFLALLECAGFVNSRCVEHKRPALIGLAFHV
jgi:RNAse (barnase) inhibitor barstar